MVSSSQAVSDLDTPEKTTLRSEPGTWIPPKGIVRWSMRLLATVAMVIAVYLTFTTESGNTVAGCGAGSETADCDDVLASRWSRWLKVPVSMPAAGVYASILIGLALIGPQFAPEIARAAWMVTGLLIVSAAGAAIWFVGLQVFAVEKFCPYCLTAHGCALILLSLLVIKGPFHFRKRLGVNRGQESKGVLSNIMHRRAGNADYSDVDYSFTPKATWSVIGMASVAITVLISVQLLFPPELNLVTSVASTVADETESGKIIEKRIGPNKVRKSRLIRIRYGEGENEFKTVDTYAMPIMGRPDAEIVLVEMFDYTCSTCRNQHSMLTQLISKYGGRLAVVVLPTPLNSSCNKHTKQHRAKACAYARLALKLWNASPEHFPAFHDWLMRSDFPPEMESAENQARVLAGKDTFQQQQESKQQLVVNDKLIEIIDIFGAFGAGAVPKILHKGHKVEGKFDSSEDLLKTLIEKAELPPLENH